MSFRKISKEQYEKKLEEIKAQYTEKREEIESKLKNGSINYELISEIFKNEMLKENAKDIARGGADEVIGNDCSGEVTLL